MEAPDAVKLTTKAEDERKRIHKRAIEGRRAAVARGVHMGRKPKLTEHQRGTALARMRAGESARANRPRPGRGSHDHQPRVVVRRAWLDPVL